ncbi:hypothetical protein V8E54_009731 [Elaphomyces granulatus]|jgi:hypothetical protein
MSDKVKDRWVHAFRAAQDELWSIEDLKGPEGISVRGEDLWKYAAFLTAWR